MPREITQVRFHNPVEILRLAGRCANGAERDGGAKYHAVRGYIALCGAKPGRRSAGWSAYPGERATCPRCQRKLEALYRTLGFAAVHGLCATCGASHAEDSQCPMAIAEREADNAARAEL